MCKTHDCQLIMYNICHAFILLAKFNTTLYKSFNNEKQMNSIQT